MNPEDILKIYKDAPKITTIPGDEAAYIESEDEIEMGVDISGSYYYPILFHELIHSTGIKRKLDRSCFHDYILPWKTDMRLYEELIAEVGAITLCLMTNVKIAPCSQRIDDHIDDNKGLNIPTKTMLKLTNEANKAVEYILCGKKDDDDRNQRQHLEYKL